MAGEKLIADRLGSFNFSQYYCETLLPVEDWDAFRTKTNEAIDALRK